MGFIDDVRAILSRLPERCQGLFVSATITPRVNVLAGSFLSKPETIIVNQPGEDLPPIEHVYYEVESGVTVKASVLCDLIEVLRPRAAMIFCNTKSDTETVELYLRRRGFDARRINSDLTQKERDYIMGQIKAQELRFLVGTDIASRGIDIEEMDLVINYAMPDVPETYMHRTGRTGRAGRAGMALSLVGPGDFMPWRALQKFVTFELKKLPLPTEEEVAQARLAHFYEMLREAGLEVQTRDLVMAQKLLKERGNIEDPSEEITDTVAKLCRFAFEHFMRLETTSLEDEMRSVRNVSEQPGAQQNGHRQRSHGGGRGGGGRDRGRRPRHGGGGGRRR